MSNAKVDNVGPLPKLRSWTNEQAIAKNPEAVEVTSQEAVGDFFVRVFLG